jgi:hypothetical protein
MEDRLMSYEEGRIRELGSILHELAKDVAETARYSPSSPALRDAADILSEASMAMDDLSEIFEADD